LPPNTQLIVSLKLREVQRLVQPYFVCHSENFPLASAIQIVDASETISSRSLIERAESAP
jgi:hypothetical protein